jgi:recombination protein RecA
MNDTERRRTIDLALVQMEKQFGKGAILRLGSKAVVPVSVISSGSISIDNALGVGGFPRGRVVEIFGPESSGKTTLALQVIAEAQKVGGTAAFIDAEHALDPGYARQLGVDVDNLLVSQPDHGEQALEITNALVATGAVDIVVVDSVAALVPKAELDGEMGDSHMGLHARLMSQALRKLTGVVSRCNTCLLFINQVREKIGVVFGNPETTTGGRALKFYCSVRIEVRRIGAIKDGESAIGNRTRAKVVKNKVAAPFREAEFDIIYGQGISREGDLLDLAAANNIVEKSGSWYSFESERIGQGRDNAKIFLKENPEKARKIDRDLRKLLGLLSTSPNEGAATLEEVSDSARATAAGGGAGSDKAAKRPLHRPPNPLALKKPYKIGPFCFTFRFGFSYHDNDLKLGAGLGKRELGPIKGAEPLSRTAKIFGRIQEEVYGRKKDDADSAR